MVVIVLMAVEEEEVEPLIEVVVRRQELIMHHWEKLEMFIKKGKEINKCADAITKRTIFSSLFFDFTSRGFFLVENRSVLEKYLTRRKYYIINNILKY